MLLVFILENLILQLVFFVGAITLIGLAVGKLNDKFLELSGLRGFRVLLASGAIGTPIHELGHAVMCVLFGHKIVEMKLYDPKAKGGKLGYVTHSYNKRNIYHRVGNFFIGVGPILMGGGVLLVLMLLFVPSIFSSFSAELNVLNNIDKLNIFDGTTAIEITDAFFNAIKAVFMPQNFLNAFYWLYLLIATCIALHMKISASDIKSGISGFFFLLLLFFIIDVILALTHAPLVTSFTLIMLRIGIFLICFLSLAVALSLLLVLIALVCKGIKSLSRKH